MQVDADSRPTSHDLWQEPWLHIGHHLSDQPLSFNPSSSTRMSSPHSDTFQKSFRPARSQPNRPQVRPSNRLTSPPIQTINNNINIINNCVPEKPQDIQLNNLNIFCSGSN